MLRGWAHYDLGQRDEAFADFDEAVRIAPSNSKCFLARASVSHYIFLDAPRDPANARYRDAALADYSAAIRLGPSFRAYVARARHLSVKR